MVTLAQLSANPFSQYLRGQYPQTPTAQNIRSQMGLQPSGGLSGGFQLGTAGNQNFIPMPGPRYQHGMGSPESGPGQGLAQLQGSPYLPPTSAIPRGGFFGAQPPIRPGFQGGFPGGSVGGVGPGSGFAGNFGGGYGGGFRRPSPIHQGLGFGGFPGFGGGQQQFNPYNPGFRGGGFGGGGGGLFQPNFQPNQPGLFGNNPFINRFNSNTLMRNNPYFGQFNQTAQQYGGFNPYQGPWTSPHSTGVQPYWPNPLDNIQGVPGGPYALGPGERAQDRHSSQYFDPQGRRQFIGPKDNRPAIEGG